ncbi:MAG TPA: isoprenylcysteine carboxylmethyltransferase family protein [Gemmatimonadaceae bacterium]|nr:isoprenylcysteine carboxylmethyltransferase family protein [Gemmatimonadaceae bacterium]
MMILRHLLSILLLPFVVVVIIPRWLLRAWAASDTHWPGGTVAAFAGYLAGELVFIAGFALFAWCVSLFARVGQGTLAPWDPTRRLVAVGPYRYMRNPMITGVVTMLAGEALYHGSRVIAIWAATFVAINQIYFMLLEEPGLERRFGAAYLEYKSAVPRWIPRTTPWKSA